MRDCFIILDFWTHQNHISVHLVFSVRVNMNINRFDVKALEILSVLVSDLYREIDNLVSDSEREKPWRKYWNPRAKSQRV